MYKVLFVCTGNICRSPTAEGVLKTQLKAIGLEDKVLVDSAGTHGYHVGEPPDARANQTARKRNILIDGLRARQLSTEDFSEFDLILALDSGHLQILNRLKPKSAKAEVALFLPYGGGKENDVPDPYYGSLQDFEHVLDLLEAHMPTAIERIKVELTATP